MSRGDARGALLGKEGAMSSGTEYALRLREVEAERDRWRNQAMVRYTKADEQIERLAASLSKARARALLWKRAAKENRRAFEEMTGMWRAACDYAGALLRQARRRSSAPCPHGCQGWCALCQPHVCDSTCPGEPHDSIGAIRGAGRP
jgi:hypothetical protein